MFQIPHARDAIEETAISTFYGDEISYINPLKCTGGIVSNALVYVLHRLRLRKVRRYCLS